MKGSAKGEMIEEKMHIGKRRRERVGERERHKMEGKEKGRKEKGG